MQEYELHEKQIEVYNDTHRFRVVDAGRRAGKTVLSEIIILDWATKQPGLYWIVCPTYAQARQIHWPLIQQIIPRDWIAKKIDSPGRESITLLNGSVIELKGAENPDRLRGVKLRGLVVDEIASIRNWAWLWSEVLQGHLIDYGAPALFISTPKGYNHFYDLYQLGQTGDADYRSFRFTSYDNPFVPNEEIDRLKGELTADTFAQEYLADFRKFTGVAHKQWDHDLHLIAPFEIPTTWQRARGFDYGSAHYTASTRTAVSPDDDWFIESCYLDNHRDIKGHADAILAEDYNLGFIPAYGDPSGAQWFTEFQFHNLFIEKANKKIGQGARGWVEYCVEKVNERLKPVPGHTVFLPDGRRIDNAPRLFVFDTPNNQAFVKQIENLKWRETATGDVLPVLDESGDPTGGHYDLMAAFRYFAVSYEGGPRPDKPPEWFDQTRTFNRPAWAKGGSR